MGLWSYGLWSAYAKGEFGRETESYIRSVIGSPAALRIEDTTTEFDQEQFYTHHHFDQDRFYKRGGQVSGSGDF